MKATRSMTLVVAVACLAACGGAVVGPTPPATATSVALPLSTAVSSTPFVAPTRTATPLPTGTPIVPGTAPTATATMPASATVSARPAGTASATTRTATSTAALYVADFATWFTGEKSAPVPIRASYDPAAREYHLAIASADTYFSYYGYLPKRSRFADFRLDVDVRRVAGPANGGDYGILFRAQPQAAGDATNARYILLLQPQEGYFALNLINATGPATNIAPRTTTPTINRDGATNHLTVICQGGTISLAINNQSVGTFPATLLTAGEIGLLVENPRDPAGSAGMEAAFSNLRITPAP